MKTVVFIPSKHKALLREIGECARKKNLPAWAVGGCVRDWILGRPTKDLDIVTEGDNSGLAAFCVKRWGGKSERFGEFFTVRVFLGNGMRIDFAQARKEIYRKPAALPEVTPANIEEDLVRRDFAANAAALSIRPEFFGDIFDPFNGLEDMKTGRLRILHPLSFRDDPTRLYRAARFAGRFGWEPDDGTAKLIAEAVQNGFPAMLSRERLRAELWRILEEINPGEAFQLMEKWNILRYMHPELKWHKSASADLNPAVRLGILAAKMGKSGLDFLISLKLEREIFLRLKNVLELINKRSCPRHALTVIERRILNLALPGLPPSAFKPLLLNGKDLLKLGTKEGKEFSIILDSAAKAQFKGEITTRTQALSWLKNKFNHS